MDMVPAMALAFDASFGSVERWRSEFVALAGAQGHAGRVVLTFSGHDGRLLNERLVDPAQSSAGRVPLLALETGMEVETFLAGIDWAAVYARYQRAVESASESFAASQDELSGALVLDVRRRDAPYPGNFDKGHVVNLVQFEQFAPLGGQRD